MRLIDADKLQPDRITNKGLAISISQIANAPTYNEWIYRTMPDEGVDFDKIEKALGFKLFGWQMKNLMVVQIMVKLALLSVI